MGAETALPSCEATGVRYIRPTDPAAAAEFDSFLAMLPQLRESHAGHFVAVRAGQVIASGIYFDPVLKLAKAAAGSEPFYCEWVEPAAGYVFRFGSPTVVSETSSS
jgi:hypothetical protein